MTPKAIDVSWRSKDLHFQCEWLRYVWITELDYFDLIDAFDICIEVTASNRKFNWKIHWQYIS